MEEPNNENLRPLDVAVKQKNVSAIVALLRKGAKLSGTTWSLADGEATLLLLHKLLQDAHILYKVDYLKSDENINPYS